MKVALPDLPFAYLRGIASALKTLEEECELQLFMWNDTTPLMDVFDEIKPDLVLLYQNQVDISIDLAAQDCNFEYIVFSASRIQLQNQPIAYITDSQHVSNFINYQKNTLLVKPSANVAQIHNGKKSNILESEVSVFNNDIQLGLEHLNILNWLTSKYSTKIFGPQKIELPQYLGDFTIFERADAIASSKVSVDLGNFDCLDAAYLKTAPVVFQGAHSLYKNFNSIAQLEEILKNILNNPTETTEYCNTVYQNIINNQTFYHRVSEIFNIINDNHRSTECLNKLKELVSC